MHKISYNIFNIYFLKDQESKFLRIRAAPIPKFPPIPIPKPIARYSRSAMPIPQIAHTFADTDTFRYN